jgi:hypothetical protein
VSNFTENARFSIKILKIRRGRAPGPPPAGGGKPTPALSPLVALQLGRLPSAAGLVVNEQD